MLPNAPRLLLAVIALAAVTAAQVQPNAADSSLTIGGREAAGFTGDMPLLVSDFDVLPVTISGLPNMPFAVAIGFAAEPGIPVGGAGLLNLSPSLVVADGFGANPALNTGPGGSFTSNENFLPIPHGFSFSVQAGVQTASGPVLTAPCTIFRVPGDPVPSSLRFTRLELEFSAGNRHVGIGDIDGNGHLDFANSSFIWGNNGDLTWSGIQIDPGGAEAALVDIIGDGNLDLVVLDNVFLGLKIFEGDGTGDYVNAANVVQLPVFCGDTGDLALVDLDGDSDLDILVADGETASPGLSIFTNLGGGSFFLTGSFADGSRTVATADLDGDGNDEIIFDAIPAIGGTAAATTIVLHGDMAPSYSLSNSSTLTAMPEGGSGWLRASDVDNDGDQDLLWAGTANQGVLLNDGSGNMSYSGIPVAPQCCPGPQMAACDVDKDGDEDVVFVHNGTNTAYVVVAVNDGAGGFATTWYLPTFTHPSTPNPAGHVYPADIDNDGDDDLVVGGYDVTILLNEN